MSKMKKLLSVLVVLLMVFTTLPIAVSAESSGPNATVTELEPMTLEANSYTCWPSGDVTIDRKLDMVVKFAANDTLEECLAGEYSDWLCDFNLKFTGIENGVSFEADNCYLAGNYGSFGWIVIPTDDLVIEEGVTYPVVAAYDASLNYKDICNSVKEFIAAIHIDPAILNANPDLKVELSLKMTNPEDSTDTLIVGEPLVYGSSDLRKVPNAIVTELEPFTLTAEEHEYMCWPNGDATIDRPLDMILNFKTDDTVEDAIAGGYSDWICDFYLTVIGTADGTITADNCYLAGNYGTFGWIVIPTDGLVIEEGVENPVVAVYDAKLTYEEICDSVKDFTAAIHIDEAILAANPDLRIELALKMKNPVVEDDFLTIGEPAVYEAAAFRNVAKIGDTMFETLESAMRAATLGATVVLLTDIDDTSRDSTIVNAGVTLDLNGFVLKASNLLSFGDIIDTAATVGGVEISNDASKAFTMLQVNNTYMPIYDTANGMYRFFAYTLASSKANYKEVAGTLTYGYKLSFTNSQAYEILAESADSISLVLDLTVDEQTVTYTCDSAIIKNYAKTIVAGNTGKVITFTATGVNDHDAGTVITATANIVSATKFVATGKTIEFTK